MFRLQTIRRSITMLAIVAFFGLFSADAAQASDKKLPYIIDTTVSLSDDLNCEDLTSTEVGRTAIMTSGWNAFVEAYKQDKCYKGGTVKIMEQVGDSFDIPQYGTARMIKVKRVDGTVTFSMILREILTQTAYDLSIAVIIGKKPPMLEFSSCKSVEDVLTILERMREATKETFNKLVVNEYINRKCASMKTEDDMVVRDQVGKVARTFDGVVYRVMRITRDGAHDIFAFIFNRLVLTAERADAMRKAEEVKK